jgi:hypothetical protein
MKALVLGLMFGLSVGCGMGMETATSSTDEGVPGSGARKGSGKLVGALAPATAPAHVPQIETWNGTNTDPAANRYGVRQAPDPITGKLIRPESPVGAEQEQDDDYSRFSYNTQPQPTY